MSNDSQILNLGEAASHFLAGLPSVERKASQQEIYKFIRWYGWDCPFTGLTAPEVANYAERLSSSDSDYAGKLELLRAFLVYARKEGWTRTNLSVHLKARKVKAGSRPLPGRGSREKVFLTQQGYAEVEAELAVLQSKSSQVIDEMRRAAADKDFRENAPLDAAKEQRGYLEGRIKELRELLNSAVVTDREPKVTRSVSVGDSIVLLDLTSGEEMHYTIVSPEEVDPTRGRISMVSPIGKAIIGKSQGEVVEVTAPVGKLNYQIKVVEH